jgi:hypothetical protein
MKASKSRWEHQLLVLYSCLFICATVAHAQVRPATVPVTPAPAPKTSGRKAAKAGAARPVPVVSIQQTLREIQSISAQGERPATLTVIMPDIETLSEGAVKLSEVKLVSEQTRVSSAQSLPGLLEANGIKPDVDALSLIYDLNPNIARFDELPPDTLLILPKLTGPDVLRFALNDNGRAVLRSDAAVGQEALVRENGVRVKALSQTIAETDPKRFKRESDRQKVIIALRNASDALNVIGSHRYTVSQRVLEQTNREAKALQTLLNTALNTSNKIAVDSATSQQVQDYTDAINAKSQNVQQAGSGSADVEVHTVKKTDGAEVPQKRVFCAPKLDPDAVSKYRDPSSPTTEALPVGSDYTFWAGEGDNTTSISDKVTIKVQTKNRPIKLQLN